MGRRRKNVRIRISGAAMKTGDREPGHRMVCQREKEEADMMKKITDFDDLSLSKNRIIADAFWRAALLYGFFVGAGGGVLHLQRI